MQHKSDIFDALADPRSRVSDLEDAFRALVGWPRVDMIKGISGTDDALRLLGLVASALVDIGDTRIMPSDTVDFLEGVAAVAGESVVQTHYMAGALYVRDRLDAWRPVLRSAKADREVVSKSEPLTPYTLTRAEGELIELVNGAAEANFVFSMGLHPETGWTLRFSDGATGEERQVSGSSFREAWTALRRGPRGFSTIKGGKH